MKEQLLTFLSKKFLSALLLSIIGVIFALTGKLSTETIWGGLQAIWGAYAVANIVDKNVNSTTEEKSVDSNIQAL